MAGEPVYAVSIMLNQYTTKSQDTFIAYIHFGDRARQQINLHINFYFYRARSPNKL